MALQTGNYAAFIGGISQQDDTVRSGNQTSTSYNSWLHAAMGAGKRPSAKFVKVLRSDISEYAHFHSIVRDDVERYVVVIDAGKVRVFDHMTGHEYMVITAAGSESYLDTQGRQPWSVFKTATLADTTFVINRNKIAKMAPDLSLGGIAGSVQTMNDLPKTAAASGWHWNGIGDIATQQLMEAMGGSQATPPGEQPGSIYHVSGMPQSPFDDFYVERIGSNVWEECAKPGIPYKFDKLTMPHILKRIPDTTVPDGFYFAFGPANWSVRITGDELSNPDPSFIDQTFSDVFLHRNRVGFLSSENVLMSETDKPFNLWRTSITQYLDSDPIDIAIPTNGVAKLDFAVPFQRAIYVTGADAQFLVSAEPYMSPKHIKTDTVNVYNSSPFVRPRLMGDSLYFVDDSGEFATLREYFMNDASVSGDAAECTAHVPRLLPGRCRSLMPNTDGDCVMMAMESGDVYVYFVRWAGDEKQQSAWAHWKFSGVGKVLHIHSIGQATYIFAVAPGGGVEMLKMDMMLNRQDSDATTGYSFLLDREVTTTPVYQALGNYTDIPVPYVLDSLMGVEVIKTDDWGDPGAYFDLQGATLVNGGQAIRVQGNRADGRLVVGLTYETKIGLTKPVIKQRDGTAVIVGRTQVRDIEIAYKDAAYFEVGVEAYDQTRNERFLAAHSEAYTARTLDDSVFKLSSPVFHSGSRRFPVLCNADKVRINLINRTPFQCWWQSGQWRGMFVTRSPV